MPQGGINRRKIQGEFFDCTIQSYNDNGHGTHKIDYALQYGISMPLSKYIEELEMIEEHTKDDKSEKRESRLYFLRNVANYDVLVNYFQHLTTYLNGGSNFPDCGRHGSNFESNKLIIIAAGGNIITIFAKLLHDLIVNKYNCVWFNKIMLNNWALKNELFQLINNCPKSLWVDVNFLASSNYSDFDYNILPNKCNNYYGEDENNSNNNRYIYDNIDFRYDNNNDNNNGNNGNNNGNNNGIEDDNNNDDGFLYYTPDTSSEKDTVGFYLFRIKTALLVESPMVTRDYNLSQGRRNCKNINLSDSKLNLFYPQAAQEDWLDDINLKGNDDYYKNKKWCKHTINNMLAIKELIKDETLNNVNTCIELKKTELGAQNDIIGAMEYIRSVNLTMNLILESSSDDSAGIQYDDDTLEDWQYFLNNFSSLDSILNSDLPFVSVDIIKEFTLKTDLGNFNNSLMDYRIEEEVLPKPKSCKYLIVPGNHYPLLKKLKRIMDLFIKNQDDIPIDGLSITFNSIIIEPREKEGDLIPNIYTEDGKIVDLIKAFEHLATDDRRIDSSLLDAVNIAIEQIESESGIAGNKKLKKIYKKTKKKTKKKTTPKKTIYKKPKKKTIPKKTTYKKTIPKKTLPKKTTYKKKTKTKK